MSKMTTYTIAEKSMFFAKRKEFIKLNAIEGVNFYIRRDQNDEDRYNYDITKSLELSPSKRLVVLSKNKYSNANPKLNEYCDLGVSLVSSPFE